MRGALMVLMFATTTVACAHGEPMKSPLGAVSAATLRADLLRLSAALLMPSNFQLDEERARVTTSREIDDNDKLIAVPKWQAGAVPPPMPLVFDLMPAVPVRGISHSMPIHAFVAAPLERDTLVAQRKLERGSALTCADFALVRKPVRFIPPQAIDPPCSLSPDWVLRRSLVAGEPVRQSDVGAPPDVAAYGHVNVRVVIGQVVLEKAGIALADAQMGDVVQVRLNGSSRHFSGRVVAQQVVLLEGTK
jgi:flagella basal body P-ring formation protein FlgA